MAGDRGKYNFNRKEEIGVGGERNGGGRWRPVAVPVHPRLPSRLVGDEA